MSISRKKIPWIIGGIALVLAAGFSWFYLFSRPPRKLLDTADSRSNGTRALMLRALMLVESHEANREWIVAL
jgi:hypothetical protein